MKNLNIFSKTIPMAIGALRSIKFISSLVFVFLITSCGEDEPITPVIKEPVVVEEEPTSRAKIEVKSITTSIDSRDQSPDFPLHIYLPDSYADNKDLPVIYLMSHDLQDLDAKGTDMLANVVGALNNVKFDAIVVLFETDGRPYTEEGLNVEGLRYVLTKEVIPFINENYENDNGERTLMAWDNSAYLSLVTMLLEEDQNPNFHNYILSNPDGISGVTSLLKNDLWPKNKQDIKLHFSVSSEYVDRTQSFPNYVEENPFSWLTTEFQIYDIPSQNIPQLSFRDGLKFIFDLE